MRFQGQLILEFGVTLTVCLFLNPWDHFVIRGQSASTTKAAHGWHRGPTDRIQHKINADTQAMMSLS